MGYGLSAHHSDPAPSSVMDIAQTSLFPATPEQAEAHRRRTCEEWGRGMAPDEYIRRDEALDEVVGSEESKFVVCSRREVAVSDIISIDKPGVVYCISAVFTPNEHRRKGYAKHMMRLLHYVLANRHNSLIPPFPVDKWGSPPTIPPGFAVGLGSTLHSEIGPLFYQSCGVGLREDNGWTVHSPSSTIWSVPTRSSADETAIEWLTDETQKEAWKEDASLIRNEIQTSPFACFAFLPDNGLAKYQQAKGNFHTPEFNKGAVWGARIGDKKNRRLDSDPPTLSFVTWAQGAGSGPSQTLFITRLRCIPAHFPLLLAAAFQAARNLQLEKVEIWNLDARLRDVGAELGGVESTRDHSLPSLVWYGLNNGHNGEEKIQWLYNERFCYCT